METEYDSTFLSESKITFQIVK